MDNSKIKTQAEYKSLLAHELGHCETASFYESRSNLTILTKQEYKANKWAVKNLMPKADMKKAIKKGCTEVWQLAEYFDATEDLIKFALWEYYDIKI